MRNKLIAVILLVALPVWLVGCSESQLAKAQKVGRVCTAALSDANKLVGTLVDGGALSQLEAGPILAGLADAKRVVDEYSLLVATLRPDDKLTASKVATLIGQICESLDRLQADGVLKVKSLDVRQKLTKILFGARSLAGAVSALLAENGFGQRRDNYAGLWPDCRASPGLEG